MKKVFIRMLVVFMSLAVISPDALAVSIVKPVPGSSQPDPATVQAAISEFKSLSGKEKRERMKEVKKAVKQLKAEKKAGKEPLADVAIQVLFAILIPPLGVYLHEGEINTRFWIDLILTLLFFIPGMIYALIIVLGDL